jgi:hypothetical protein
MLEKVCCGPRDKPLLSISEGGICAIIFGAEAGAGERIIDEEWEQVLVERVW